MNKAFTFNISRLCAYFECSAYGFYPLFMFCLFAKRIEFNRKKLNRISIPNIYLAKNCKELWLDSYFTYIIIKHKQSYLKQKIMLDHSSKEKKIAEKYKKHHKKYVQIQTFNCNTVLSKFWASFLKHMQLYWFAFLTKKKVTFPEV